MLQYTFHMTSNCPCNW